MDKHLVKLAIKSADDNLIHVINKFLFIEAFTTLDVCHWWRQDCCWLKNYKYVRTVMHTLRQQRCLRKIGSVHSFPLYAKTEKFIEILLEILKQEELIQGYMEDYMEDYMEEHIKDYTEDHVKNYMEDHTEQL